MIFVFLMLISLVEINALTVTKEDQMKEYMLLSLRKIEGVKISEFKNKFVDNPIYIYRESLSKLVTQELIEIDIDSIKLMK